MPTSMVLRFRDFGFLTISKHQELIDKNLYVWWGWWNKPNEKIPRDVFADFKTTLSTSRQLPIFLVDSGKEKLYRALLEDIVESETDNPIPCNEPAKTPDYYSNASYKAWFKFRKIEEIDASEIRNWSYDEVKGFLDDPASDRFQDKRAFDIQEMLNRRHRTIYFLRPYRSDDSDYRLELLPPVSPANFITAPIVTTSNYILQLSDVHFGVGHHGFSLKDDQLHQKKLSTHIIADLDRQYKDSAPAAVIISGDLTWQGKAEEFEFVARFIQDLTSVYGLEAHRFVVVPGNHDMQWSDQEPDKYDLGSPVTRPQGEAERNYRDFYKNVFGLSANEYLSMGRRYILGNYVPVDIVGMNSCRLEQKHFAGYGYVGLEQLNHAAEQMHWDSSQAGAPRRVLVLHHHIIPVTPQEELKYGNLYSLTLDAGQLTYRALDLGVDLIVHGHMHQPFAAAVSRVLKGSAFSSRTMGVHGAGSAGVKRDLTGEIGKNTYSILEFDEKGNLHLKLRTSSDNFQGFDQSDLDCYFVPAGRQGLRLGQPPEQ